MRLLDQVANWRTPLKLALTGDPVQVFDVGGPSQFSRAVADCPFRYVLTDDLTRACADLAFADGARLAGCLDLLRFPAPHMWIEWNDAIYQRAAFESGVAPSLESSDGRVGVLLRGALSGESTVIRTFWNERATSDGLNVEMAALESHIDLRARAGEAADTAAVLGGGRMRVTDELDHGMAEIFEHVRFRFDDRWAAYYRAVGPDTETLARIVRESLAGVARDAPFVLAFCLLLNAHDAVRPMPVSRAIINRKRERRGQPPLLDHLEVHASLRPTEADQRGAEVNGRHAPRLHHVRGHLVRRDNVVYWRTPHLRGSASRGVIRSRTVRLSFEHLN